MLELLLWPLFAGVVLTAIHAYFGLHVLARGIVFVDLSLAQVAALGLTIALLAGHTVDSAAAYWYALGFALGGAVLFAVARRHEAAIQQEVVIGIVYAVCAALGVIVLDRAPQGAEHIKQLLIGSILTVDAGQVARLAGLYAGVGVLHWLVRKPLIRASFHPGLANPSGIGRFLWDVVFYGSFAVVVTSSVRIAGVLLVFSYLIVPAAIAGALSPTLRTRLLLAWAIGTLATALGLAASWAWDLPTGPAIVATFGAAAALTGIHAMLRRLRLRAVLAVLATLAMLTATSMLLFPQMDQPWLDVLEKAVPGMQRLFLVQADAQTRDETVEAIDHAETELAELRAREQDVRWGATQMPAEKQERLRQYLAARAEIVAGDQLVLRELRLHARARQRWMIGLPLLLLSIAALPWLLRRDRNKHDAAGRGNAPQQAS